MPQSASALGAFNLLVGTEGFSFFFFLNLSYLSLHRMKRLFVMT